MALEPSDVETLLADLPPAARDKLRRRLDDDPKRKRQTEHELAVGAHLARLGYIPEYEKPICGRTPDWYVPAKGCLGSLFKWNQTPTFIVEVTLKDISDSVSRQLKKAKELSCALRTIPVGATLRLCLREMERDPDASAMKAEVEEWLTSSKPSPGDCLTIAGAVFRVTQVESGNPPALRCRWVGADWQPPERLRNAISRKVRDYEKLRMPLVVAVGAHSRTAYDEDDMATALFVGKNGLLGQCGNRALSAAIWIPELGRAGGGMRFYYNENAKFPLPKGTLGDSPA